VVRVRETRIRHDLRQHALQRDLISLLLLSLLLWLLFLALAALLPTLVVIAFLRDFTFTRVGCCALSGILAIRGRFRLIIYWLDVRLNRVAVRHYRVKSQICCMRERVNLLHCDTRIFLKLVRTEQAQNRVCVISENDVTRRVELNQYVVLGFTFAKSQIHDAVDTQLRNVFQLLRAKMLS